MKPGRTGSDGRPWVQLRRPKPPRIRDEQAYWLEPPPAPSPRCVYWVAQIEHGWLPNRRISMEGYHTSAIWYGVYIWEYLNIIAPLVAAKRQERTKTLSARRRQLIETAMGADDPEVARQAMLDLRKEWQL